MSSVYKTEWVVYICISIGLCLGCRNNRDTNFQHKLDTNLDYEYIIKKIEIDTNQYSKIIYDSSLFIYDSLYILNRRIVKAHWYYSQDTSSICFLDDDTLKCLFFFALYRYAIKIFPPKYEINRRLRSCNTAMKNNENTSKQIEINSLLYLNKKTISVADTIKVALLFCENNKDENSNKQIKKDYCCQYLVVKEIDITLNTYFNSIYNEVIN